MKKTLLTILAIGIGAMSLMAQEEAPEKAWKFSGVVGLNASATGLVNWAAGGNNNVSGVAFSKLRLLYDKDNLNWETNLDLEYGLTYVDQKYDKLQKSSDHLIFDSKFGWQFRKSWLLTVNAAFQTQFGLGRKYTGDASFNEVISNIVAPSYTDISVGIDWKPNSIFSVYLSPVAGRITTAHLSDKLNNRFAAENPAAYAINPDGTGGLRQVLQEKYGTWAYEEGANGAFSKKYKDVKAELGLTLKGSINYTYKDLKIITNLTLYTPYAWDKTPLYLVTLDAGGTAYYSNKQLGSLSATEQASAIYSGYRDNNRRFGNFDVDWTVAISYQFLKCLNVTLSTNLKYYNGVKIADKDGNNPVERVQFQAILGLGVGYSF